MEAQITAVAPSSTALVMAMVIPRSLNEPVGLTPSYLRKTRQPSSRLSHSAGISGVLPSPSVTGTVSGFKGRCDL